MTEENRGVYFSELMQAVPADEAGWAAKGIRRAGDKVREGNCVRGFMSRFRRGCQQDEAGWAAKGVRRAGDKVQEGNCVPLGFYEQVSAGMPTGWAGRTAKRAVACG